MTSEAFSFKQSELFYSLSVKHDYYLSAGQGPRLIIIFPLKPDPGAQTRSHPKTCHAIRRFCHHFLSLCLASADVVAHIWDQVLKMQTKLNNTAVNGQFGLTKPVFVLLMRKFGNLRQR